MTRVEILNKKPPVAIIAMIIIVAGAGAAAGATMAGSIGGEMTTTVDQAIVVNSSDPGAVLDKQGMVNVNDDGTSFRTTAEIHQGDNYPILMNFTYNGQTDINAEIDLDVPEGLTVDVVPSTDVTVSHDSIDTYDELSDTADNVTVGQVAEDKWLLRIDEDNPDNHEGFDFQLGIEISTENEIEPGFYTVEGQLYPVDV